MRLHFGLVLIACSCAGTPEPRAAEDGLLTSVVRVSLPAPNLPDSVGPEWLVFEDAGFRFRYPPDGALVSGEADFSDHRGTAIRGPMVHVDVDPNYGPSEGHAYQLVVSKIENPGSRTIEQWVDSLVRTENANRDPEWQLSPATPVKLRKARGLQLVPDCGDCVPYEVYLGRGQTIVVVSFTLDISYPGDTMKQLKLYRLILDTFEWKE